MTGLNIPLIIVSIVLIITVLLQQRSVGLGGAFGGDSAVFTSRRGAEKTLYRLTIILAITLVGLILWSAWLQKPAKTNTEDSAVNAEVEPTTNTSE